MPLPNQAHKLARQLFPEDEARRQAFTEALERGGAQRHALIWMRERPEPPPFQILPPPPWQPAFVDQLVEGQQAGQHPLHEAGSYYCLDMSSVFAASVMSAIALDSPAVVVDVCAAPGGKSVFAWRLLKPARLVANETIRKRTRPLIENLSRCGVSPAVVTSCDPAVLADACGPCAPVVIVDAPCSGQSLIARGKENAGCFHPATINLNANRQRRILAHSARIVAPGGYLVFITCTYAEKENEGNARWFLRQHGDFSAVPVAAMEAHQSHLAGFPCYRLWPQDGIGAGAFAVLFRRAGVIEAGTLPSERLQPVWSSAEGKARAEQPSRSSR